MSLDRTVSEMHSLATMDSSAANDLDLGKEVLNEVRP